MTKVIAIAPDATTYAAENLPFVLNLKGCVRRINKRTVEQQFLNLQDSPFEICFNDILGYFVRVKNDFQRDASLNDIFYLIECGEVDDETKNAGVSSEFVDYIYSMDGKIVWPKNGRGCLGMLLNSPLFVQGTNVADLVEYDLLQKDGTTLTLEHTADIKLAEVYAEMRCINSPDVNDVSAEKFFLCVKGADLQPGQTVVHYYSPMSILSNNNKVCKLHLINPLGEPITEVDLVLPKFSQLIQGIYDNIYKRDFDEAEACLSIIEFIYPCELNLLWDEAKSYVTKFIAFLQNSSLEFDLSPMLTYISKWRDDVVGYEKPNSQLDETKDLEVVAVAAAAAQNDVAATHGKLFDSATKNVESSPNSGLRQ